MSETRKLAAILVADVVGYSRPAGADEERTLARLRGLRSDLIDPAIAAHHGRIVKRTGDGSIIEFRSAVDAVRCAVEMQTGLIERNAGVAAERRIEFRVGIHVGDVIEESDGDLMGDGMNVVARLEGICEPGGIYVSEDVWRHVRDKIKDPFVDLGEQTLKNIARPVRVFALKPQAGGAAHDLRTLAPERREPPRLSIVVLPFANIGGDPEQDYFVDGVTDSLTTDLSRIRGAFVIGRSTAFTYKGKTADVRQIGRELNVRYVLEGSVQRGGKRLRVNVQLLEAETASHIWAERFERPVADLFDMQDEIVSRLANALGQELAHAEATRAERAANPDSMDHYFLGLAMHRRHTVAILDKARFHYDRALDLDPDNVDALVARAWIDLDFVGGWLSEDRRERLLSAEGFVDKALKLRPDSAHAHLALGAARMYGNRAVQGIAGCERALAIDRNLANAHAHIGLAKLFLGRGEETEAHVLEALRISPRDANASGWTIIAGTAKFHLGRDEEALVWLSRSLELNPNSPVTRFCLAATLAQLDRLEEACEAARACLELNPGFTIARFRSQTNSDHPVYLAGRERMYEGLRKAGIPEH
jgi:TolB-like protein/class 3 adenylate cyclase